MKILILCALTLAVASASEKCAWGESHWCSSLQNAKECGAFSHCLSTIWKNEKLAADGTQICTYCQSLLTDIKSELSGKKTQDQITAFMKAACSIVPDPVMSKACAAIVDDYMPEVMQMIQAEIDPQTICALLGLCKGLEDTVQHKPILHRVPIIKVPQIQAEPICTDCKKFMGDIKNMVTGKETEQQIEQLLEQNLCARLGALQDECKTLVEAYVPEIMNLLSSQFNPAQLCQILGFCAQDGTTPKAMLAKLRLAKSSLFKAAPMTPNDAGCDICKTVIGELVSMEKDKMTQKQVEDFIKENLCSHLGALRGACEESVDEYGPALFQLLIDETDPTVICQSIGLCTAVNAFNAILPVRIEPQQPPKPAPYKDSAGCIMCEFVVNKLDTMLQDNATEAEIQAALDKVCSFLPQTISQECQNFIDTYAKAVLVILSQEGSPQMVCTTLGLCKSDKYLKFIPLNEINAADPQFCGVCEMIMQYVDTLLTQNATIHEIEALVEKICNFLPKDYRTQCDDIVEQYGPAIIQLLSQFADPKEVCTELGLCGNKKIQVPLTKLIPGQRLLGAKECTFGPSYWCASQENAEKCQAVAHCKKHVWNNN